MNMNSEKLNQHKKHLIHLHKIAERFSEKFIQFFIDTYTADPECQRLSNAEYMVLATFTGTLFAARMSHQLHDGNIQLKNIYTQKQIEQELLYSIKYYSSEMRRILREQKEKH